MKIMNLERDIEDGTKLILQGLGRVVASYTFYKRFIGLPKEESYICALLDEGYITLEDLKDETT